MNHAFAGDYPDTRWGRPAPCCGQCQTVAADAGSAAIYAAPVSPTARSPITSLFPQAGEIDPVHAARAERRIPNGDRPWVFTNMITTLDGATAVNGLSGLLGGPADQAVFKGLRSVPDVVLVGSATANAERYRTPQPSERTQQQRVAAGQRQCPDLAILSRSLNIDDDLPALGPAPDATPNADPLHRLPIVITTENAPAERRAALEPRARILTAGDNDIDLGRSLDLLAAEGHRLVLLEGGPTINGLFAAADLIDEWNLSLAPLLAAGTSARAAHGPTPDVVTQLQLSRIWQGDGLLFGRWLRSQRSAA